MPTAMYAVVGMFCESCMAAVLRSVPSRAGVGVVAMDLVGGGRSAVLGPRGGPPGATRTAPGSTDLADGSGQAVGTLEWRDLEGGFWAVIGGTGATGDVGKVVAVLANAAKDDPHYTALAGRSVRAVGKRLTGASIRMAGPEIEVTSIETFTDTGAPAQ